ncbi:TRAF3-interacting protein 1 isoform X2 [Cynoglossus semilaevis]|uniref:TRAF3-interacting protein 1 n=1 Tax=Cynoglossus semilaevis TaxID=244447 RepID=A0A3P8WYW5_CYNSE|nr:TRAF3-interacting protein 1 isoform X2 [Cynoglossus semilaevis]
MNAAVVKKTQDTLGKVIRKPPLTEKLLNKPPFRYLHDILSEVIRTTGFLKGLYGENELKSDNVKEKDAKIVFLQKTIDVVMLVTGEPLAAKPARIVAGQEPEKTNELLQAIAKCCLNKISSDDAVKQVLTGEKVDLKTKASTSRSQDKENREGRERPVDREKKISERSGSREQKDPELKEQEGQRRDGTKERHRDRERSDEQHRSDRDHGRERDKDKSRDRERERERDKDRDKGRVKDKVKSKEKDKERSKERDKTRENDSQRESEKDREKRKEREKERERRKDGEERRKNVENGSSKTKVSEEPDQKPSTQEPSVPVKPVTSDSPARIPRPSSAKGQRRRPKIGGQDASDSEGDGEAQSADAAGFSTLSDATSSNKRLARPSSARPAPPRVKRQESHADVGAAERLSSAKSSAPIILDGKKTSEDEDEQFLVEEAVPPPSEAPDVEPDPARELDSGDKHGGLVKKILETKKDYEGSSSSPKSKPTWMSEAARKEERDIVTRDIERLRSSIQTVCRNSLPLGKIIDYFQEDRDAMQAEWQTWQQENKELAQALQEEQRATDVTLDPLKAELTELEQQIKDQQDKICAVRFNILKNEEKIQRMVTGINSSFKT